MKLVWEGFIGLASALITSLLVLGAITLAMTEGMILPSPAETPVEEPTSPYETMFAGFATSTLRPTSTKRPVVSLPTQAVKATCPPVAGWERHVVLNGENLNTLAAGRGVSADELRLKNCLDSDTLYGNSILYLPTLQPSETPQPLTPTITLTSSVTPRVCGPFRGWVLYTVQSGDTIFRLSIIYGTNQDDLLYANCMARGEILPTGKRIWVPNVAPRYTATSTPVPPQPTSPPPTIVVATPTFTRQPTILPTFTFTPIATTPIVTTRTFTATFTQTAISTTVTPLATATLTRTPAPTGTNPATKTSTPNPLGSLTPTNAGR